MGMSEIVKSNLHVLRKQSKSDIPAGRQFVIETNEVTSVECSVRRNQIQQAADRIPLKLSNRIARPGTQIIRTPKLANFVNPIKEVKNKAEPQLAVRGSILYLS